MSLLIRGKCVLALLVDLSGKLLDLSEELGLIQPGLGQTPKEFSLSDGHFEIVFDVLLTAKLRQDLVEKQVHHHREVNNNVTHSSLLDHSDPQWSTNIQFLIKQKFRFLLSHSPSAIYTPSTHLAYLG